MSVPSPRHISVICWMTFVFIIGTWSLRTHRSINHSGSLLEFWYWWGSRVESGVSSNARHHAPASAKRHTKNTHASRQPRCLDDSSTDKRAHVSAMSARGVVLIFFLSLLRLFSCWGSSKFPKMLHKTLRAVGEVIWFDPIAGNRMLQRGWMS